MIEKTDYLKVGGDSAKRIMEGVDKFEKSILSGSVKNAEDATDMLTYVNACAAHSVLCCILTMMTKLGIGSEHYDGICDTFCTTGIREYLEAHKDASIESLTIAEKVVKAATKAGLSDADLNSPEIRNFILNNVDKQSETDEDE